MEEMIERVAKAIYFRGGEQDDMLWKHGQRYLRDIAIEQARAAIEAMRSPTDDMLLSGNIPLWVWEAMIDAALSTPLAPEGGEK